MHINFNSAREFSLSTSNTYVPELFGYTNIALSFDGDDEAQLLERPLCATSLHLKPSEF